MLAEARAEEEVPTTESISTEGDAVQEDGYYLCGLHGYVAVYLSDKTTIYELTKFLSQTFGRNTAGDHKGKIC